MHNLCGTLYIVCVYLSSVRDVSFITLACFLQHYPPAAFIPHASDKKSILLLGAQKKQMKGFVLLHLPM